MIRAAIGISSQAHATRAALEAAGQVAAKLGSRRADWGIAFVTADHRPHLTSLLECLAGALETPDLVGCSAFGIVVSDREVERPPALGLLAVTSDRMRATPFLFGDEGDRGLTAGVRLGQRFAGSRGTDDLLLVLPDPFHVRPDRLLHSLDAVLAGLPVVGGAASGDASAATFQFCGTEVREGAVSGLRLTGDFRHVVGVTQGCRALGPSLRVTRSHENLLLELDGEPAVEVLRRLAPKNLAGDLNRALHSISVGLVADVDSSPGTGIGEYIVRHIVAADPDTGLLVLADSVEEGQQLVLVQREPRSARADMARMLERVRAAGAGRRPRFGLYFNCLARGRSLYGEPGVDASLLARAFPRLPLLGFFSNAEVAPLRGSNQLFTYTGVLLLVAD